MHSTTRGHRWTRRARPRRRQPFPSWSLDLPSTLAEAFVADGSGYWHAWEANRSVSLTSMLLTDGGRPVTAAEIAAILPPLTGELIDEFPPHLIGRAAYGEAVQPARASHAMSGMLVATGTALCVTITTDDFDWARQVWLSIRHHPIPPRADEPRH